MAREVEKRKAVVLAIDEMEEYVAELQDQITDEISVPRMFRKTPRLPNQISSKLNLSHQNVTLS